MRSLLSGTWKIRFLSLFVHSNGQRQLLLHSTRVINWSHEIIDLCYRRGRCHPFRDELIHALHCGDAVKRIFIPLERETANFPLPIVSSLLVSENRRIVPLPSALEMRCAAAWLCSVDISAIWFRSRHFCSAASQLFADASNCSCSSVNNNNLRCQTLSCPIFMAAQTTHTTW